MKKYFWFLGLIAIIAAGKAIAQDAGKFYENLLISDEMKIEENSDVAKDSASKLLNTKPETLKMKAPKLRRKIQKTSPLAQPAPLIPRSQEIKAKINYGAAPFGLTWGASMEDVKNLGVNLEATGEKDYINNFSATLLPKSVNEFRDIVLTFGEEDTLWRIIAYGDFIKDTPQAEKVLSVYNKYYRLLDQKYGNAQQFYTPKVTNVDKTVEIGGGRTKTITEQREEPIGGKNFLAELQSGEAVLYATFENGKVGVALAVNVDGEGRSYIIIDYKNLEIMKAREQNTLEAL